MTAPVLYTLRRHRDISNVSGTGDVATIVEFGSGLTVLHWDSDTPSVQVHTDMRHIEMRHGHGGASEVVLNDMSRLLRAYQAVVPVLLRLRNHLPIVVAAHPDHPDRLRVVSQTGDDWAAVVEALGGSTDAAVHVEVAGEIERRWVSPDGDVWCVHYSPLPDENPLQRFHEEDR